ncbi:MAG TPA: glycosyltransferase [Solirubrobacteraceae bacterium]|nr:glycosyltransferase [Solirubrobacteraceae bacterium]
MRPLTYSAVIPTKDRGDAVGEAVGVLLGQTRLPERIVVVDASARPYELPDGLAADVEVVVVPSRPSTSAQRNLGARQVETPVVLFLDDDVRLPPDYAEALLAHWEAAGLEALGGVAGTPAVLPRQGPVSRAVRRLLMLNYVDPAGEAMTLRRSGNVRYVPEPRGPVRVPALGAGATAYRTELVRANPFDERFAGYAPGEDLEMAFRVGQAAPLLQTPEVRWAHLWDPRERTSPTRWRVRGRCETYFRLRRLDRSPLTLAAFALSLVADAGLALVDSVRDRDPGHARGFAAGALESIREELRDR